MGAILFYFDSGFCAILVLDRFFFFFVSVLDICSWCFPKISDLRDMLIIEFKYLTDQLS